MTPKNRKALSDILANNLVTSIWEVLVGLAAILAPFLQKYLGDAWGLVFVLCIVAGIIGLLLRKSRWLPLLTFLAGVVISGTVSWKVTSEAWSRQTEKTNTESVKLTTPHLALSETWVETDKAEIALDGKVSILCDYAFAPTGSASLRLHFPDKPASTYYLDVGENEFFQIYDDVYYLTLLEVQDNRAKVTITYIPPELVTPTPITYDY